MEAFATPLVRLVPKIVKILPGERLTEESEAAFTIRNSSAEAAPANAQNTAINESFRMVWFSVLPDTLGDRPATRGRFWPKLTED